MNDRQNDKVINCGKINNDNKPTKINNIKSFSKEYSQKEKEYLNKYLNISKNILNEEKLYNIIIKFDFNEQLILSEIFQLLEEASENEKDENKINIIENKSIFIPYKTHFGIEKSIYNLKNEKKPKRKILSKDKMIYKYENNKKINNEKNQEESINNEDMNNNCILYQKRFSNFNKIVEDYKNKKYKEENNYFFYKKNKNTYKNKYLGDKYNINNQNNINKNFPYKYYNSKKIKNENYIDIKNKNILIKKDNNNKYKELITKNKKNYFIKENVIYFEYIQSNLNTNEKKEFSSFLISNKSQLIIRASYTKSKKEDHNKDNKSKIIETKNKIEKNSGEEKNFPKEDISIKENLLKQIDNNNNKCKNFNENNNILNNKYMINKKDDNNKFIKIFSNSIENNNIAYSNMNLNNYYQYNNNNLANNKNFMFNITNNNIAKNSNLNNYNNVNINNNNHHSNNNFLLNNKIGIPFYFYPYYLKSNSNIMMSKYINTNSNINNNFFINSFYNPQMIRMYYQGFNNFNINIDKAKYFNNLNKNFIYNNIMNPINPTIYNLLMNKIGIKFIPTENFKRTIR